MLHLDAGLARIDAAVMRIDAAVTRIDAALMRTAAPNSAVCCSIGYTEGLGMSKKHSGDLRIAVKHLRGRKPTMPRQCASVPRQPRHFLRAPVRESRIGRRTVGMGTTAQRRRNKHTSNAGQKRLVDELEDENAQLDIHSSHCRAAPAAVKSEELDFDNSDQNDASSTFAAGQINLDLDYPIELD
ncbi:hypothetical protein K438DRAFT_1749503 [Mycena galopus ATCC 62051]|nr:hypothetical protein K438DRAFT_1749503 [Mycena galopus ATCC 62051]